MSIPSRIRLAGCTALLTIVAGAYAQQYDGPGPDNRAGEPSMNTAPGTAGSRTDGSMDTFTGPTTDSALTTVIKSKLLAINDLKSTGIHVATKGGMVTLSGRVPSEAEHKAAIDVARSIDGVRAVNDRLKVVQH